MTATTIPSPTPVAVELSLARLHVLRGAYLFIAGGLVIVKWPLLFDAHTLPLYEGVTLCLLTAMSLLAFVGLRHPVRLVPLLLFESLWKLVWLGLVALPRSLSGSLDAAASEVLVNCSLVVLVLAATPWRHVWDTYVRMPGARWR